MDEIQPSSSKETESINCNNNNNDDDENKIITPAISISTFIKSKKSASTSTSPPKSGSLLSIQRTLKTSSETPIIKEKEEKDIKHLIKEKEDKRRDAEKEKEKQEEEEDDKSLPIKKNSIIQHIVDVKWRDKYGFVSDDFFVPELKKFEAIEEEQTQEKMNGWAQFHEQYNKVGLSSNPKQFLKLLAKGIPHSSRGSLWKVYSGSFEKQRKEELLLFKKQKEEKKYSRFGTIRGLQPPTNRKSYYLHLQSIIKTSNRLSTKFQSLPEIDKDIARTFPGHPFFESDEGKRKLSRVLQAYSIRNRKVGYCQSMNIVAGFVLFVGGGNEEDAFWLLSTIVEDFCQNYYSTNLMGSQVDMSVFSILVAQYFPKLFNHMQEYDVSLSLMSTKWFMCLFVNVLPTEIVLRIWDHLFVECGIYGYHKPASDELWLQLDAETLSKHSKENGGETFRCNGLASYNLLLTGLSVLAYFEETLLNCHSTPHLLTILSTHAKGLFKAKEFFKYYQKLRNTIPEDYFNGLKRKSELIFLNELEDMRKARDLHQTLKFTRFSKNDLEKIWSGFRQLEISSRYSMGKSMILDFKMFQNVFQFILPSNIGMGTADENNTRDIIIKQLFKAFDKNKDGTLDFTELMSGLCILAKGTSEERLKLYFSFFDSNGNGFISKSDMKLMLENVYDKIELDPLAATQYSIEEYVEMIFSNYSIPEGEGLSFDMFRQAIASYPRIFRCFMLEEEEFSVDIDNFLEQQQEKSSITNHDGSAENKSSFKRKATKGSRIQFQEVLIRESELENSKTEDESNSSENNNITNTLENENTVENIVQNTSIKKNDEEQEENNSKNNNDNSNNSSDEEHSSKNRIGFSEIKKQQQPTEQKGSTVSSSVLMDAIEKAKIDKPQPNIIIELKSNNYSTTTVSYNSPQPPPPSGNPLSCCKFM
ncbi:hypothetical protein RB653_002581 [Dictyostelium firmibasis]|uniref:RabGAP/TBC domain-containing protein n=1 Tax=Dictyostelium firmibasis TaxID=79012 RepID=A0AAN7U9I8_9MYCE